MPSSTFQILTVQSSPPDAISPFNNAAQVKTNPVCPPKELISWPSVDHNFTFSSFEQDTKPTPGISQNYLMISPCASGISFYSSPLNQILIFASYDPVIIIPFGRARTATAWLCPSMTLIHSPVLVSQILAVPSQEPLTSYSGMAWLKELTAPVCPSKAKTGFPSLSMCNIF